MHGEPVGAVVGTVGIVGSERLLALYRDSVFLQDWGREAGMTVTGPTSKCSV